MNTILIKTICDIAVALTIHQVINDKQKLFEVLKIKNVELTEEIFNQAIDLCKENCVITSSEGNVLYQTNSLLKSESLSREEMSKIIKGL